MSSGQAAAGCEPDRDVVIIGAGFAGLCMGAKLGGRGISYRIIEAGDDVGGVWWANRYPGVGVDVPSISYSFSFYVNPDWSRTYPLGSELLQYAKDFADEFGVTANVDLRTAVRFTEFDDAAQLWRTHLDGGAVVTSRFLIGAWGGLTTPHHPEIEGLEEFEGPVVHSARWPEGLVTEGKRIGVIGTGASAVQVVPAIAPEAERLSVFQRTGTWVLPRPDFAVPPWVRRTFRRVPAVQRLLRWAVGAAAETVLVLPIVYGSKAMPLVRAFERLGRWWVRRQVEHPALVEQLTPTYGFACKRPTFSNTYLRAFNGPNVALVTAPIERITASGVRTADGVDHELDLLVLATGFKLWEPGGTPPVEVRGREGLELGAHWEATRYSAYHGVSVPGFPNLFLATWGPYGLAGPSYLFMIETNVEHILRCMTEVQRRGAAAVEIRREAHDKYFAYITQRQSDAVMFTNNCGSSNTYYLNHHGDAPLFRPHTSAQMWYMARNFPLDDYTFTAATSAPASQPLTVT